MIEQQVTDRFRDAVVDEPPLGFDPDDVIDRAIKRTGRRKVVLAVAAATMVEAVAVWAFSGTSGGDGQVRAARPAPAPVPAPDPAPAPPTVSGTLTAFEQVLTVSDAMLAEPANATVYVHNLVVHNPDGAQGTAQLKRTNGAVFEISIDSFRDYDMHFNEPIVAYSSMPLSFNTICHPSAHDCGGVTMTVSGVWVVPNR
jgi:hypothetical protein